MRTELLGQEKNVVRIKVEFEAAEFMTNLDEVIRGITKNASIPGFRKGRIPRKVLDMRFGRGNMHREALEKMLPEAIKQVTEDYGLDVMDAPSLKIDDIHEGEPVTCELVIEVRPEVELPELEDIEIERLRQEVKDETLDIMTEEFRKQFAVLRPVDRPAGENDAVSVLFTICSFSPDETEVEMSVPQPSSIDLADPNVRAEVRNALLGKSKGDDTSAEFEVERDHRDASLAGKKIRYEIKINDVSEKILPDMEPEFYKKVMNTDIETEDDFRKEMRTRMLEHQEREEEDRVCEKAVTSIMALSKIDVPDSLLERQIDYVKEQDAAEVKERFNIGMEEYLGKIPVTQEQYEQMTRAKAAFTLRRMLVLDEIGKKFGVEVKQEDLEAEISRLAVLHGTERARIRAHYYKNETNMSQLSNGLRYDKIGKLILDKIKIKDVDKLSVEEAAGDENGAYEIAEAAVESEA